MSQMNNPGLAYLICYTIYIQLPRGFHRQEGMYAKY